jgi:hypothetical protein
LASELISVFVNSVTSEGMKAMKEETRRSGLGWNDGGGGDGEDSVRGHVDCVLGLLPGYLHDHTVSTRAYGVDPEAVTQTYWDAVYSGLGVPRQLEEEDA